MSDWLSLRASDVRVGMVVLEDGYPASVVHISHYPWKEGRLTLHYSDDPADRSPLMREDAVVAVSSLVGLVPL